MGKWTKKTEAEIKEADSKKDYTNGYEFFPWLWYMRKMYVVGLLGNLVLGWYGGIVAGNPENDNPEWMQYAIIGFFGIFAPVLIAFMLVRDYRMLKKGQTS